MTSGNGSNGHAANGHRPSSDRYEVADDLARLLEQRKFARKDGPFKGFNSPPGRF